MAAVVVLGAAACSLLGCLMSRFAAGNVTLRTGNVTLSVTSRRDMLARARPPFGGDVTMSRCVTSSVTYPVQRDSDMPGPAGHVTITRGGVEC